MLPVVSAKFMDTLCMCLHMVPCIRLSMQVQEKVCRHVSLQE